MSLRIRRWESTRKRILIRDGGVCGFCGGPGATTVDHIIPRALGGLHEDGNLRAAHLICNSRAGQRVHRKPGLPFANPSRW